MECSAEPAASMKPKPTTGLEDKLGVTLKEIRQIILRTLDKESKKNASLVCLYWHAMIWELTDCLAPTSTATDDHFKDFNQTFPYIFQNIFSLNLSNKENIRGNTLLLFPNLKALNLSHHIMMPFNALKPLTNLTSLNLNVNMAPMEISFLTALTNLSLSYNPRKSS